MACRDGGSLTAHAFRPTQNRKHNEKEGEVKALGVTRYGLYLFCKISRTYRSNWYADKWVRRGRRGTVPLAKNKVMAATPSAEIVYFHLATGWYGGEERSTHAARVQEEIRPENRSPGSCMKERGPLLKASRDG